MPLAAGTRLGPYEIVAPLGAGGMGEVYRARDTRLDRTIAVKVLHPHVAGQEDRRQRFEREARAVSNLNHPHICALHDIGRQDATDFLVMEYLEGETLEERLAREPIPLREALEIALQVAAALDAAHRQGIVHRDLKPGNIMLTAAGAKLLDFGIARMTGASAAAAEGGALPTIVQTVTMEGFIAGTLQYMAPEQLEGKEADARTDIFAFGALLYEVLTGRKAFQGSSHASVITAIMSVDPPEMSALKPSISPALDHVVRKCLAKSPENRWQSARDLLGELQWIVESGSQTAAPAIPWRRWRGRAGWIAAALFAALFLAALFPALQHLRARPAARAPIAFTVPAPAGYSLQWFDTPVVSPDGERIAFTASAPDGTPQLFVRHMGSLSAHPVPNTEHAYMPFWSPDSRQVAFFSRPERRLKKVDLGGGPAQVICNTPGGLGGSWSPEGVILFARSNSPLQRVAAEGGEPREALSLAEGEGPHIWPEFLPDGQRFIFYSIGSGSNAGAWIGSLDSGQRTRILDAPARYANGYLLFPRSDVLMARPFDPRRLAFTGEAFPAAEPVMGYALVPGSVFSASRNGVLSYRTGGTTAVTGYAWFDRTGKRLGPAGDPGDLSNPALSPDGRHLAYGLRDPRTGTRDIWVLDLARGSATRITFDPANDFNPAFSPDGSRIAFTSDRKGHRDIYLTSASGTGNAELIIHSTADKNVEHWSPDGRYLVYNEQAQGKRAIIAALPLAGERIPAFLLAEPYTQDQGQISPNGRWIAYRSDETGRPEVYVQSFTPGSRTPSRKWRVSTAGGVEPYWRADGRELYYLQQNTLMAVEVRGAGASFEAGIPKPLFTTIFAGIGRNRYVAAPDGQRFLLQTPLEDRATQPFNVLIDWDARRR